MLLSFEIPTKHVKEYAPLEDFEFGLAHLFLKTDFPGGETYIQDYQHCLLDNSMYELGAPMSTDALLQAAALAHPIAIIAPDWMDEREKTLEAMYALYKAKPKGENWTIGAVVQGKDFEDRKRCYVEMRAQRWVNPICFPFRSPREETIPWLFKSGSLAESQWYHLLGLRNTKELTWDPPGLWSCDTSKPFKGYMLHEEKDIRGKGTLDLHKELSLYARRVAAWNIAYMRQLTRDHDRTMMQGHLNYIRRKHGK